MDPWIHGSISFIMNHKPKKSKIFKRPKNREDGSKLDDFWTKSITLTRIFFENNSNERASEQTNQTIETSKKKIRKYFKKFSKNIFYYEKQYPTCNLPYLCKNSSWRRSFSMPQLVQPFLTV